MKIIITPLLLLFPALTSAMNYQNMSEADTQKMMAQMQKAQACMAEVDQSELKKFEARANQMEARVKELCASGQRDEAEQEAIAFGQEVSADPAMKKMQECGKLMQGAMPGMPGTAAQVAEDHKDRHICDN
jgi:Skp family chaperone for outer membrane proteins